MNYTYPNNYKVKNVSDQVDFLRTVFPETDMGVLNLAVECPKEAEGLFVIPHYKLFGTYNEAVKKVLAALKKSRSFYSYIDDLEETCLRQTSAKAKWWEKQDDVVLLPAQFGERHKGKSVEQVRTFINGSTNEIGLGAYEVGIMLLTHPERFQDYNDLCIDCPGDEYDYPGDGTRWFGAPIFGLFDGARLGFGTDQVDRVDGDYGAASGFLPQYLEPGTSNPRIFDPSSLDPSAQVIEELWGIRNAIEALEPKK